MRFSLFPLLILFLEHKPKRDSLTKFDVLHTHFLAREGWLRTSKKEMYWLPYMGIQEMCWLTYMSMVMP